LSDPEFATAAQPLAPFTAWNEPATNLEKVGNVVGHVVGQDPRFWPTSRWVMLGLVAVALIGMLVYAFVRAS
jgi:hypothetical protein